ncbi:MerR family transcriptional regulator [Agromyces bauzanensis]
MIQSRASVQNGSLRTVEVSRASGYSVQQVRDLERLGVIPPATRAANGYRRYSPVHVHALRAYRGLAAAIGPVEARRLLARTWSMTVTDAAADIGSLHVRLATERERLLRAQDALRAIQADDGDTGSDAADGAMGITELASALGVRSSTLRFWEQEDLVTSRRVTSLQVRVYDPAGIRAVRIVAALRSAGYRIPAIRTILASLDDLGGRDTTAAMLQHRLDELAARTVALLEAGADFARILRRTT